MEIQKIEDIDDFFEYYCELIIENKTKFTEKIFNILNSEEKNIKKQIWLRNWNQQLFQLEKRWEYGLYIDKIIARWYWKEIMFLILYYAVLNNIKTLKLKAEPLLLEKDEQFEKR